MKDRKNKTIIAIVSTLLVASMILGMIPAYALTGIVITTEVEGDGIWIDTAGNQMTDVEKANWSLNNSNILKYTGEFIDGRIVGNMPATIDDKPVTNLNTTFQGCTGLVEAPVLPSTATQMTSTFQGCTSLVAAPVIPDGVTTIASAFAGCASLVDAPSIPNTVANMYGTFSRCTGLVNVGEIPNSVTNMTQTFEGCTSLEVGPVILGSVKILDNTFEDCTNLRLTPSIGEGVEELTFTFKGCTSLTEVTELPQSIKKMQSTFKGCTGLIEPPVIPENVLEMSNTFRDCSSLVRSPIIPDSVKKLTNTFMDCTSLKEVQTLGSGITDMSSAFQGCSSLENPPVIPEGVTNLSNTFNGCKSLSGISNIPDSATNVNNMFYACQQLYGKVELPDKYKDSNQLFAGCVPDLIITVTHAVTGQPLKNVWIKFNMVYYDQGLTDENGQITFKGAQNLPEGSCILKFMYGGIVKDARHTFTINENSELAVTFGGPGEVLADNRIFGTITNSGIPISNAEIHVSNKTDGDIAVVTTSLDGSYEVVNLPNNDYTIKATYKTTTGTETTTIADADQEVNIDLNVPVEKYKLTGTVTNKDSEDPVGDICIIVTDALDNELNSSYSNEDGSYEIADLANGNYKIYIDEIIAEKLVTDNLEIKDKDEVLNIQIIDSRVDHTIIWNYNGYTDEWGDQQYESVFTTDDIDTECETLWHAPFNVAYWDGHKFLGWFTEATGGEKVTEETTASSDVMYYAHWEVCETHKISGTVTIRSENPGGTWHGKEITDELWLQGFYVALIDKNNFSGAEFDWVSYELKLTPDNRTGTYEFTGLPDGDYTVAIWNSIECKNHQSKDTLLDGEDKVIDFIIGDSSYTITGTVTNENTKDPIPGVEVKIKNEDGDIVGTVTTEEDGSYELPDLPDGDYTIIVTYPDPDGNTDKDIVKEVEVTIDGADKEVNIELGIPKLFKISGRVTWKLTGNPVALADIELKDENGNTLKSVKTDNQGHYEFKGLSEGTYKVSATYKGSGEGIEAIIVDKKEGED